MKKRMFPSAETVGRSSGRFVLILEPRFSILMTVDSVMMFSFCGTRDPVSASGCDMAMRQIASIMKNMVGVFTGQEIRRER